MYVEYWNFRQPPFRNIADSRFWYASETHERCLQSIQQSVQMRHHGGRLTGPRGMGKTLLLARLGDFVRTLRGSRFALIDYLPGPPRDLAREVLSLLGLGEDAARNPDCQETLGLLRQKAGRIGHTVLAIDEAQDLTDPDTQRFLHRLTNIPLPEREPEGVSPAITLILATATGTAVPSPDPPSPLMSALEAEWRLQPLTPEQTLEYVQCRVRAAGGDLWVFDRDAIDLLAATGGIPGRINQACDRALTLGHAANARVISETLMQEAIAQTGMAVH